MHTICLVAVDIRSTYNVGSLFRTCDGMGAELILIGITPTPKRDNDTRLPHAIAKAETAIAKTALGAEKTVRWQYFETLQACALYLRNKNYKLVAIEQSAKSKPLSTLTVSGPTALIVGPEVDGLSKEQLLLCNEVYEIPMKGDKESFNVAVAAGMALYQTSLK